MILLDKDLYYKTAESLRHVAVNCLFAHSVTEKHVTGSVFVDHAETPLTFYVVHPYGMSLLFGSPDNEHFNLALLDYLLNTSGIRSKVEWLQAYPDTWNSEIAFLLGEKLIRFTNESDNDAAGKVVQNTRVNFSFSRGKYFKLRNSLGKCQHHIVPTSRELFEEMQGTVVPQYFWNSADDFCKNGIGFSMIIGDKPVSTAYSAYILDDQLELGIETSAEYRGKGFAFHTCTALIDYCIEHDYEPVWSCRLENTGSFKLAQKLGFEPIRTLPYYRLPL